MTYIVLHGPAAGPHEQRVESVAAAARVAVSLAKEGRKGVRVRLPDGRTLDFEAFQDAVFQGALHD